MIPARQLWLQLGPDSHFDLLHGQHGARVALAHKDAAGWHDRGACDRETASALVLDFAARRDWDTYLSQSGFSTTHRRVSDVAALPVVFVDLDTYKVPGLEGITRDELLDRILAQHPWLPVPTMAIESGRGHYLVWSLVRPLDRYHLDKWQAVEAALVDLLIPFGADPAAKDAARVLRIVGGVNQRNGAEVIGHQVGHAVTFERLEQLVLTHAAPCLSAPRLSRLETVEGLGEALGKQQGIATAAQRAQHLKPYKLHFDRMEDYEVLAHLRGSPGMKDYRHRLLYCYAVSGAWYWPTLERAVEELRGFSERHFAGSSRYNSRRVQTVLDRMEAQLVGRVAKIENGQRVDWRYRLRNATIIRALEITAQEQRHLRTVIGKEEVQRRRADRRRNAGMVERDTYLSTAKERRSTALLLRARGMTQAAIARELGITQGRVSQILKDSDY